MGKISKHTIAASQENKIFLGHTDTLLSALPATERPPQSHSHAKPWSLFQWLLVFLYFSSVFAEQSKVIAEDGPSICEVPEPWDLPVQDYTSVISEEAIGSALSKLAPEDFTAKMQLHPFATPPSNDILKFLLENDRLELLKTINTLHPEWINEDFAVLTLSNPSMTLAEEIVRSNLHVRKEVMARAALNTVQYEFARLAIELMSMITSDNDIANTLQHRCAELDLTEHEKLLLIKGARPDFKKDGATPLDVALKLGKVEFTWLMVKAYQSQNIPMTEERIFDVMSFFKRTFEKMWQRDLHGAASSGFFKTTPDSNFQKVSVATMAIVLATCFYLWRKKEFYRTSLEEKSHKQTKAESAVWLVLSLYAHGIVNFVSNDSPQRRRAAIIECRQKHGLIMLSPEFNQYLDKFGLGHKIAPEIMNYSDKLASLFPLCIIKPDGRAYHINEDDINSIFENKDKNPKSAIKLLFENPRADVNLISYLKIKIEVYLKEEVKHVDEKMQRYSKSSSTLAQQWSVKFKENVEDLQAYQKELSELRYPFELFDSIDACLGDPNTQAIMEHPCIAPNGVSYEVTIPEGNPTCFEANIEGLGNVIVYRNFELQAICEDYRKFRHQQDSVVDSVPMSPSLTQ